MHWYLNFFFFLKSYYFTKQLLCLTSYSFTFEFPTSAFVGLLAFLQMVMRLKIRITQVCLSYLLWSLVAFLALSTNVDQVGRQINLDNLQQFQTAFNAAFGFIPFFTKVDKFNLYINLANILQLQLPFLSSNGLWWPFWPF